MFGLKLAIALVLTCSLAGLCLSALQPRLNSFTVGQYDYFGDTEEMRTRQDALNFCREQGGELAKVWNRDIYKRLRNFARTRGSYWIDGIDRQDPERFESTPVCQPQRDSFFDFSGIPAENINLPQVSCLSFVKGTNVRTTMIESANCNDPRFVVCQSPVNGCDDGGVRDATTEVFGVTVGAVG